MAKTRKADARPLLLAEMTWPEVKEYLERDQRLIIPVGTCEQHGRHLPLGTGSLLAERLAHDLSAESGVLVAPTLNYGVNVDTEQGHAGTASFRRKTLHRALNDGRWRRSYSSTSVVRSRGMFATNVAHDRT